MNKLALLLLQKALKFYRLQSKPLISNLGAEAAWMSGVDNEEKHLDSTQRIIERRLQTAISKPTGRRR
jgi:hypothetical protein